MLILRDLRRIGDCVRNSSQAQNLERRKPSQARERRSLVCTSQLPRANKAQVLSARDNTSEPGKRDSTFGTSRVLLRTRRRLLEFSKHRRFLFKFSMIRLMGRVF